MTNMTLSIPEEIHQKMMHHPEFKWSEIARQAIEKKINEVELMDRLTKKSKLTKKDVDEIAHKINREVFEELNKK